MIHIAMEIDELWYDTSRATEVCSRTTKVEDSSMYMHVGIYTTPNERWFMTSYLSSFDSPPTSDSNAENIRLIPITEEDAAGWIKQNMLQTAQYLLEEYLSSFAYENA